MIYIPENSNTLYICLWFRAIFVILKENGKYLCLLSNKTKIYFVLHRRNYTWFTAARRELISIINFEIFPLICGVWEGFSAKLFPLAHVYYCESFVFDARAVPPLMRKTSIRLIKKWPQSTHTMRSSVGHTVINIYAGTFRTIRNTSRCSLELHALVWWQIGSCVLFVRGVDAPPNKRSDGIDVWNCFWCAIGVLLSKRAGP